MSEESWHQARLIPTSGISGADEQERRATSALLAVLSAVREFGRVLTQPLGAPAGNIETFIEVPFQLAGRRLFPDGLIRVRRGQRVWTALVEVKTGSSVLESEQLENYLEIAKSQGFDALITISNEIPPHAGQHPTSVDRRKLKSVSLHHFSWSQILAEAVMQKEHRGVADPDQAWILSELIRYLEHPRSGALEFDDMGSSWVQVRDSVMASTLRAGSEGISDVTNRFEALLRYSSLQLGRRLGTEVVPALTRKEQADPAIRSQILVHSLTTQGTLSGAIKIPDAVGQVVVTADLRASKVTCYVDIEAPKDGKSSTRVNWLVRQLKSAPESLRLEAFTAYGRGSSTAELLSAVRENPLLLVPDAQRELRSFRIALDQPLGAKRGKGKGGFVDSVRSAIEVFYTDVLSNLKAWTSAPQKIREDPPTPVEPVADRLISNALSSQDGDADQQPTPLARIPRPEPVQGQAEIARASAASLTLTADPDVDRPRLPTRRELRLFTSLPDPGLGQLVEAGWYEHPDQSRALRWWTGNAWTSHVHKVTD